MQTVLIVSKDKQQATEYAKMLCLRDKIDTLDTQFIKFEKTVGIEDIRNFQKKLFLTPFKSKTKALILNIENSLTDEAQNALLKALEEPPNNTVIILTIDSAEILLPTVISRCTVINLKQEKDKILSDQSGFILSIDGCKTGERLKLAQDNGKTKEDAKKFLESLILTVRDSLLKNPTGRKLKTLKALNRTYKIISDTNANQRLALENLLLWL